MVDELFEELRAAPLLKGLSVAELRSLTGQVTLRTYGRRQMIFGAGDDVECVFLLRDGMVRLYQLLPDGHELTLGIMGAGEMFGISGLLSQKSRTRFAQSLTPSRCLCLPIEALLGLFGPRSDLVVRMTAQVGVLVERTEDLATSLAFRTVRGRLAQTLLRVYGEANTIESTGLLRLTHADLAAMVGTTREHVTRLLTEFEQAGYISKEHGHVATVCDPARLRRESEEALTAG